MSTSTSTSSKTPPLLSRIKLNPAANSTPRTYTGKHLPPGQQRSVGSGTKTRPPPLPSPTPNSNAGGGGGAGGAGNGVMSNANTGPGTRVSGRRTTHKPGEFANLAKGKGRGGSADDKGKGAGVDEDGDSLMLRGAPAKVGLRLAGNKPLLAVMVWSGGRRRRRRRRRRRGRRAIGTGTKREAERNSANVGYVVCRRSSRKNHTSPRPRKSSQNFGANHRAL